MKKLLAITLALSMTLGLAGCGGQQGGGSSTPPSQDPSQPSAQQSAPPSGGGDQADASGLKVAVLVPGSPTDGGFCQLGAEAGMAVQNELGCEVTVIEAPTADKIKSEAEALADEGYNIIFGHGGEYSSPFAEIAGDYPDVWFVTCGGTEMGPNQFPFNITYEEFTYVAGVLMAMMSQTGKIGMMVGGDFPAYTKTTRSMELGAKSVNPDMECMYAVLSNVDMNEAYETTMNQINAGADFVFSNADAGTLGSLKAANEKGVYSIGALADYSADAPESCIVSGICDYNMAYIASVKAIMAGIDEPQILFSGMADGAVRLVWNENLKSKVPQEVLDAVDDTIAKIESGEIHVPNEYE
ncbi:BMP family ABC transporter substrate-binding protein [Pseudoflavonifractor sp. 524-17]|uniref:BMP family protein n=1 Tax=Pseudoflavonifractor sp. 524-17 TaxID=2304577 RepID=UPI00137ADF4F|nr:BMP family protein [Pseudoflavonifractor sp. 524-17]NCE65018.1 BMP family ABC transporter substrate-binding protein [Pseudoflavonifractor sp. 524-17]